MAQKDIEVEIKIPLRKSVFERLRRHLKKKAKFIGTSREIDKYFNPPHRNFLHLKHSDEYLRVRTTKGKGSICYKRIYLKNGKKTRSDEYQSFVEKPKELEKTLKVLDFTNFLNIDKRRETYLYKKEFEIDLDQVKELGYFIEIESLKDFGGIKATMDKVLAVADKFGLNTTKIDKDGYVLLLMKKKGLSE